MLRTWPVWKTIPIGGGLNNYFLHFLRSKKWWDVEEDAFGLFDQFGFLPKMHRVDLVKVTLSDLELAPNATLGQVLAKASARGLKLCPQETGPWLRMMLGVQDPKEQIVVASMVLGDGTGKSSLFCLRVDKNERPTLGAVPAFAESVFGPRTTYVFRKPD